MRFLGLQTAGAVDGDSLEGVEVVLDFNVGQGQLLNGGKEVVCLETVLTWSIERPGKRGGAEEAEDHDSYHVVRRLILLHTPLAL